MKRGKNGEKLRYKIIILFEMKFDALSVKRMEA